MLRERILVAIILIPALAWVIYFGGWVYTITIALILALAAWEYGLLFRRSDFAPSLPLLAIGVAMLCVVRFSGSFEDSALVLALLSLGVMTWHLVDYEKGAEKSGSDFAITLGGVVYLGWIGSYLISLRQIADGQWWFLIAMPSVWLADSTAYFVGKWIGRHRLSPRLSPKKTWEGYLAGIIIGGLTGLGFTYIWRIGAGTSSTLDPQIGLITGLIVSVLAPLGDLGISMIKREIKVKDTGNLLPGHGGVLDRIDSWIWAGVIGYYVISWSISWL
jgi:phosphatidate cytidylyltransferase